ncbi:hypothetical protein GCM10014719_27980 [Planomonospora parontospora subsp. antibiotica]|nr:hypothetical protein GCM10014719_27980 [Planomonospora parontospora subsp. antibiotica]GII16425.1 hypothetical protein Ppa05_31510 [Planomonospora parontospora subsp. antibiotica]
MVTGAAAAEDAPSPPAAGVGSLEPQDVIARAVAAMTATAASLPCRLVFNIPDPSQVVARIGGRCSRGRSPTNPDRGWLLCNMLWERSHEEWTIGNRNVNMPKLNRYILDLNLGHIAVYREISLR